MSKIFEEAIADAKKLKEVAESNAKKAIISLHIRFMII